MNSEIAASIVRKALAPNPAPVDGKPRETPLEERLRLLNNALGSTSGRVEEQRQKLASLKKEIDDYRALMDSMKQRAVEAERLAKLVEPMAPPAVAPGKDEVIVGALHLDPVETVPSFDSYEAPVGVVAAVAAERPSHPWLAFAPYAVLAGLALLLQVGATDRSQLEMPSLKMAEVPAPAADVEVAAVAAEVSDQDILAMIHEFVPPGGERTVGEILGPELEAPSSDMPWTITRVDEKTTLVSFRPYGEVLESGPVYEFSVDAAAGSVQASPETLANLRGGDYAAAH